MLHSVLTRQSTMTSNAVLRLVTFGSARISNSKGCSRSLLPSGSCCNKHVARSKLLNPKLVYLARALRREYGPQTSNVAVIWEFIQTQDLKPKPNQLNQGPHFPWVGEEGSSTVKEKGKKQA